MWDENKEYPVHLWKEITWEERVEAFLKTEDTPARFNFPFPMGVFGTLREGNGNNRLMHRAAIDQYRLAFLPHFYAEGLGIRYEHNCCAPFEIFYYTPEEWVKMIYRVDRLESFDPQRCHSRGNGGYYYRTLAWLRLLPKGYADKWFPKGRPDLGTYRDMAIDPTKWNEYEHVPCWIYSNMNSNVRAAKEDNPSVIWPIDGKEQVM